MRNKKYFWSSNQHLFLTYCCKKVHLDQKIYLMRILWDYLTYFGICCGVLSLNWRALRSIHLRLISLVKEALTVCFVVIVINKKKFGVAIEEKVDCRMNRGRLMGSNLNFLKGFFSQFPINPMLKIHIGMEYIFFFKQIEDKNTLIFK